MTEQREPSPSPAKPKPYRACARTAAALASIGLALAIAGALLAARAGQGIGAGASLTASRMGFGMAVIGSVWLVLVHLRRQFREQEQLRAEDHKLLVRMAADIAALKSRVDSAGSHATVAAPAGQSQSPQTGRGRRRKGKANQQTDAAQVTTPAAVNGFRTLQHGRDDAWLDDMSEAFRLGREAERRRGQRPAGE